MKLSILLVAVAAIIGTGGAAIIGSNLSINSASAVDDEQDLPKYHNIKQLARAVDIMKFDDDNINWNHFKNTNLYQNSTAKIKLCIKDQAELGNSLSDYEVMDCVYENYHIHETTHHS